MQLQCFMRKCKCSACKGMSFFSCMAECVLAVVLYEFNVPLSLSLIAFRLWNTGWSEAEITFFFWNIGVYISLNKIVFLFSFFSSNFMSTTKRWPILSSSGIPLINRLNSRRVRFFSSFLLNQLVRPLSMHFHIGYFIQFLNFPHHSFYLAMCYFLYFLSYKLAWDLF